MGRLRFPSQTFTKKAEVLVMVRQDGFALLTASEELRADRDVVLAAVRRDGKALGYASEALQSDRDVVLAAVQRDGEALEHASDTLRADRDIIAAAVAENPNAIAYASTELLLSLWYADGANDAIVAALRAELARHDTVEVLDVDTGETLEAPAPKRQRTDATSGIAVLAEHAEAAKSVLVRVKDEKREAEEETEDAHGLSSDLARTVDALQTKIDELAELAKASGADPRAISDIKERKNVCN